MVKKREQLIHATREMRYKPTEAEKTLWEALQNRKLAGLKFRRQCVIGPIIADFYCASARLVIEVDGDIHDYQKEYDSIHTRYLEDYGYIVSRFKNDMVLNDLVTVLLQIKAAAFAKISAFTPAPSPNSGRGEKNLISCPSPDSRGREKDLTRGRSHSDLTPQPSPLNLGEGEQVPLSWNQESG